MMMIHEINIYELNISPKYFSEIINGHKVFEIRKNINFKEKDMLILNEYDAIKKQHTGCKAQCEILYVINNENFPEIPKENSVIGINLLNYTDFDEPLEGE